MGNTHAPSQVLYVNNTEQVTFTAAIGNVTYAIGPDLAAEQAKQAAKKKQKEMDKQKKQKQNQKENQKREEANKNEPKKKSWGSLSSGFKLAKGMGSLAVKGAKLSASLFDDAPQIPLQLFEIQEAMENNNNTLLLRFPSVPDTANTTSNTNTNINTNIKPPTLPGKHGKYNCGVCGGERCLKVKVVKEGREVTVGVGFLSHTVKAEVTCTTCGRETKTRGPSSAPYEVWKCGNAIKTLDPYNGQEQSKQCSAILCMDCCPNSVPVRYGMPVHLSANFNKGTLFFHPYISSISSIHLNILTSFMLLCCYAVMLSYFSNCMFVMIWSLYYVVASRCTQHRDLLAQTY
jgi:hypothetical protein